MPAHQHAPRTSPARATTRAARPHPQPSADDASARQYSSADDRGSCSTGRWRPVRADPAVPNTDRARGRVLLPGRRRDVPQRRPSPPRHSRRAAPRPEALGRTDRGRGPGLGYLHRGVEKICENSDYYHVIDQVDPLEYVSSLFQEWAAVLSFEKLMDVQVPRRAEYIRVLSASCSASPATPSSWASWPWTWAA